MAKHKCPECENHERWLVAFADMMTLLFALFVVLFSIASVEQSKLTEVAKSVQEAFGVSLVDYKIRMQEQKPVGTSFLEGIFKFTKGETPIERYQEKKARDKQLEKKLNRIRDLLQMKLDPQVVSLEKEVNLSLDPRSQIVGQQEEDGIRLSLLFQEFFESGSYQMEPAAQKLLDDLIPLLETEGVYYHIEGHSDNQPFSENGLTNWELSSARAANVVRYFIEKHNFPPILLAAVGYADTRPLVANTTPEQRKMNRRVDIKLFLKETNPVFFSQEEESPKEDPE